MFIARLRSPHLGFPPLLANTFVSMVNAVADRVAIPVRRVPAILSIGGPAKGQQTGKGHGETHHSGRHSDHSLTRGNRPRLQACYGDPPWRNRRGTVANPRDVVTPACIRSAAENGPDTAGSPARRRSAAWPEPAPPHCRTRSSASDRPRVHYRVRPATPRTSRLSSRRRSS